MYQVNRTPPGVSSQPGTGCINHSARDIIREFTNNFVNVCNSHALMLKITTKAMAPTCMQYLGGATGCILSSIAALSVQGANKGGVASVIKNVALSYLLPPPYAVLVSGAISYSGYLSLEHKLNAFSTLLKDLCELRKQGVKLKISNEGEPELKALYDAIDTMTNSSAIDDINYLKEIYFRHRNIADYCISVQKTFLYYAAETRKDILDNTKNGEEFHPCVTQELTCEELKNIRQTAMIIPYGEGIFIFYTYNDNDNTPQRGILHTAPTSKENINFIIDTLSDTLKELSESDISAFKSILAEFSAEEQRLLLKYSLQTSLYEDCIRVLNGEELISRDLHEQNKFSDMLNKSADQDFKNDLETLIKGGETEELLKFYHIALKRIKSQTGESLGRKITIPDAIMIAGLDYVPVSGTQKSEINVPISITSENIKTINKDENQYVYEPPVSVIFRRKKRVANPVETPVLTTPQSSGLVKNAVEISPYIKDLINKEVISGEKINKLVEDIENGKLSSKRTQNYLIYDTVVKGDSGRGRWRLLVEVPHKNNTDSSLDINTYVVKEIMDYHKRRYIKLK